MEEQWTKANSHFHLTLIHDRSERKVKPEVELERIVYRTRCHLIIYFVRCLEIVVTKKMKYNN